MNTGRICIVILATAVAFSACNRKETADARLETFPVRVENAVRQDLEETLTLVGTVKARDEAILFSRVPGKLLRNLVKEADRIEKNAPVALVERDEVGVKFEPAPVPSTLTGVVARVYLDRGANVTLSTPIALVVDQSQVLARADVPERYAGKVSVGKGVLVRVAAHPDRVFRGKVTRLSPVVDVTTRSTYMEAALENTSGLLKSGMFANVEVVLAAKSGVLAVPLEAFPEGGDAVFVVENGKARRREVRAGLKTEKYAEIVEGLTEGAPVVTFGLFGLKDGSPVEILP